MKLEQSINAKLIEEKFKNKISEEGLDYSGTQRNEI